MTLPVPDGVTASSVVDKYLEAIGGENKLMAVKSLMMTSTAKVQGIDITLVNKVSAPNKTSIVVSGMGQTFQKVIFDGEKGYQEAQGKRTDMEAEAIAKAKVKNVILSDLDYKHGELIRVEPLEGKNAYVLKYNETEVFYDIETGLKVKEVVTTKTPDGAEMQVPTIYSDYKEVNGLKFPHTIGQKMGPMDLTFTVQEIKINEGVSDEDFK